MPLLAAFLAMLVVLSSFGNHDPIYTRFLLFSYPFLLMTAVALHSAVGQNQIARVAFGAMAVFFGTAKALELGECLSSPP